MESRVRRRPVEQQITDAREVRREAHDAVRRGVRDGVRALVGAPGRTSPPYAVTLVRSVRNAPVVAPDGNHLVTRNPLSRYAR
ncbi:hypothetical protein ACWGH2_38835 [Streptomyces sp. NPDC054871]